MSCQIEAEVCNCSALRQAARHASKLYDDALAPSGLSVNQYSILARLGRIGPSTIGELAARLVMDRSTLGRLLRPLAKRGLVRLQVSKRDRRRRALALTPPGTALVAAPRPLWAEAQRHFERTIGVEDARLLRAMLKRVETAPFKPAATGVRRVGGAD